MVSKKKKGILGENTINQTVLSDPLYVLNTDFTPGGIQSRLLHPHPAQRALSPHLSRPVQLSRVSFSLLFC